MRALFLLMSRLYVVLAVLAGVPTGPSQSVLCLAPNRHVAFEAGAGRSADTLPTASGRIGDTGITAVPNDCGNCVDVPFGTPVLSEAFGRGTGSGSQTCLAAPYISAGPGLGLASATASSPDPPAPESGLHTAFPPSRTTFLRN